MARRLLLSGGEPAGEAEMLDTREDVVTGPLIAFCCAKPSHRAAPSRLGRGGLCVHARQWAYCDGLDVDEDHEWQETGGVTIDRLINWQNASVRLPLFDIDLAAPRR